MSVTNTILNIQTAGQGFYEITDQINQWVAAQHIDQGQLQVFCRHTSASLTIQENADPDVLIDLQQFFQKLVPENSSLYRHTIEGPDDMPAHIKSALSDVSLSIPVIDGRPVLGTWQGVYLIEHRTHHHNREVVLSLMD